MFCFLDEKTERKLKEIGRRGRWAFFEKTDFYRFLGFLGSMLSYNDKRYRAMELHCVIDVEREIHLYKLCS